MTITSPESRKSLRQKILGLRQTLSKSELRQKSEDIFTLLLQLKPFQDAKTIFFYVNFRSEVETMAMIRQCLKMNITVCVPLTKPENSRLIAYIITDPEKDLQPGYCNIPEPDPAKVEAIDPLKIDTVILPGSVFDRAGGRLGYGGGYYDRFLANDAPNAARIGLAFELQIANHLPLMPHDQPLHYLVTEEQVLDFCKSSPGL